MNRNILGLDDIRIVVDEDGSVRLFKVKDKKDSKNTDEIFKLENDVEQLQGVLKNKKIELKEKLIYFVFGVLFDLVIVGGSMFMLAVEVPLFVVCLFAGLGGLMKGAAFGTILGNIIKRKKLKSIIKDIELKLEENEEELNELKKKSSLQELEVYEKKEVSNIKYAFHFEPEQGINRAEETHKQNNSSRGYALRLERKSLNELLRDNK